MAGNWRASVQEKKRLDAALEAIRAKQPTGHPRLLAVHYARRINEQSGGVVIAPWDVEQLDEEWLEVFNALADENRHTKSQQEFEQRLQQRRNENPTYRKYLRN